jgi:RND family efflux transporter MFP subunit
MVSSSPGIFRYVIVPTKAGIGKLVFDIKNKDYTDQIVIDNVTVYADAKSAIASQKEEPKGNQISYLKEQAWKIEFANMKVTRQSFNEIIKTTGEILPAQGDEMVVTANTNGIVTFSGNKAVVGTSVRAGEMLFAISGKNLTDGNTETRYTQAKVAYDKAKADFDRAQELVKDNIVSQRDFLDTKARYETEQANYNNLSRNYQSGGQKVVSPISGFVKNVLVTEGQYVSVGQPIASVSQNRSLVLKVEVSQKYFSKLPLILSANFKTAYDNKTYSIEALNGKLLSYGKSNDAATLFIPVTFSFDNKGEVVPGSLVDVYLKLQPFDGAIVIPVSALIEEQGVFFAYVQTAGESVVKRELKLGGSDGINVQVLTGLTEGERVVTKGAYQIKLATASGAIPAHGHAH